MGFCFSLKMVDMHIWGVFFQMKLGIYGKICFLHQGWVSKGKYCILATRSVFQGRYLYDVIFIN